MVKGLIFLSLSLGAATASAMPILTCSGDMPVWSLRERRPQKLNAVPSTFVIESRRDAQVAVGDDPSRPWITIHMTAPLAWAVTKANYNSFMVLKINSDKRTYFKAVGSGIYENFESRLNCTPGDDGRG